MFVIGNCHAYDGATSESSHAAGGALLAGALVKVHQESDHRARSGFTLSMAASAVAEGHSVSRGAKLSSSLLDIASRTAGAAAGAWLTDRYLLIPTARKSYVGVILLHTF